MDMVRKLIQNVELIHVRYLRAYFLFVINSVISHHSRLEAICIAFVVMHRHTVMPTLTSFE